MDKQPLNNLQAGIHTDVPLAKTYVSQGSAKPGVDARPTLKSPPDRIVFGVKTVSKAETYTPKDLEKTGDATLLAVKKPLNGNFIGSDITSQANLFVAQGIGMAGTAALTSFIKAPQSIVQGSSSRSSSESFTPESKKSVILHGDLTVDGFENITLLDLSISAELNEHTKLRLTGILKDGSNKDDQLNLVLDKQLKVKKDGNTVFSGIVTDIKINSSQNTHCIEVTSVSETYKMDIEKKYKSFQDENMPYTELIQQITQQHPNATFMDKASNGALIGKPIIQYGETNWNFLKRIATHFNTSLIASVTGNGAQFYVGLPNIDCGEIINSNYTKKKDLERYQKAIIEDPGAYELNFIYYEVETDDIYDLGDIVTFKGVTMYITKMEYKYEKGVIRNLCTLRFKEGAITQYEPNKNIVGSSLFGKVIATARDCVKIHLEIDAKQDSKTAHWYPYASMYASSGETGWYCMPELGDIIRLYHPNDEESSAMAISSVKPHDPGQNVENVPSNHRMSNPDVKYLRTAYGKEVKFRPDGIDIIARDGTVFMSLNDDGTVILNSNDKISFTAVNDIEIKAKNINVEATDHIMIGSKNSIIDLKEDIVVQGTEVKTN